MNDHVDCHRGVKRFKVDSTDASDINNLQTPNDCIATISSSTQTDNMPSEVMDSSCQINISSGGSCSMNVATDSVNKCHERSVKSKYEADIAEWISKFRSWTNVDKEAALNTLATSDCLDFQQIRLLLSLLEPQLQRDFISLFPKELALYVLSFLEPRDLCRAAQTCRYWRILCEDNLLWREKCREEGLLEDNETIDELFRRRISNQQKLRLNHVRQQRPACQKQNQQQQQQQQQPQPSHSLINSDSSDSSSCPTPGPSTPVNEVDEDDSNYFKHTSNLPTPPATASFTLPNLDTNVPTTPPASSHEMSHANHTFIPSEYKIGFLRQKSIEFNWRHGTFPPTEQDATSSAPDTPNSSQVSHSNSSSTSFTASSATINKKGRLLKPILQLKGHDDHVITCLQFNSASNLIVSGSDDNTLKVWSSTTGKCLRTLTGHTGGVWSSQLSPCDIVISGSTDRTLKVWNALSGECIHTLYGHTSTVRCMALDGDYVVSGSRDSTLRVWDITTGQCCHVLTGHLAAVRCVQFSGNVVVSGAYDNLVKVWDVHSETCLHTLEGHTNRVYSLQFDGINIVSGSLDTHIRVWSAANGSLKHTLIGHQSLTSGMQLRGNILVSGNADSTVKVWDINTGQCLQTLAGSNKHQSAVTCLQFNSKFVITSSDDGTVKLWDLKTGHFIRNLITLPSGGSGGVVWRIRASNTQLVCAVGSRNGTEETKLLVLDFLRIRG